MLAFRKRGLSDQRRQENAEPYWDYPSTSTSGGSTYKRLDPSVLATMASRSAPLARQKKRRPPIKVEKVRIDKATTLRRRSPRTKLKVQNSQQLRRSPRLQDVRQSALDQAQRTQTRKRPREEQFDPTLPKRQKRSPERAERFHPPTQTRQRVINLRKKYQKEPSKQQLKDQQTLPASCKTANPEPTNASYTPDIRDWVLRVASDTRETKDQPEDQLDYLHNMHRFLAEGKLRNKRSSSSLASGSQSDQGYQDIRYPKNLEASGVYMKDYRGELPEDAKKFNEELCQMLERERLMPQDTLFSDDYFEDTMEMIQGRNEAFIIQTILHLMFPHVQEKAVRGEKDYEYFIQSFNEGWNSCKKLTQTRPQPDSAIGLGEVAFSPEQLEKLRPHLGDSDAKSDLKATFHMYFPFLTLEVKSGNVLLDVADKQNAHSAGIAGLGLGGLFRITGKE